MFKFKCKYLTSPSSTLKWRKCYCIEVKLVLRHAYLNTQLAPNSIMEFFSPTGIINTYLIALMLLPCYMGFAASLKNVIKFEFKKVGFMTNYINNYENKTLKNYVCLCMYLKFFI